MKSDSGRLRVVVDTNLFVSGLLNTHGQPYQLLQALRAGAFTVLMSAEQRAELDRVLHRRRLIRRYHLPTEDRDTLLSFLDTVASPVALSTTLPVTVRDAKDEIILITAVEGAANYLVTGDDDLLTLNGDPALGALQIVTVRDFLAIMTAPSSPT